LTALPAWNRTALLAAILTVSAYGFTSFLQKGQLAGGLPYRLRGILRPAWYAFRAFLSPGRRPILPYSIQYLKRRKPTWFREDLSTLLDPLRDKKINPMIAQLLPLSEARRAQELLGQGSVRGKIRTRWPWAREAAFIAANKAGSTLS